MDTINSLTIDISVELGATKMPVHQLLRMGRGAVIELETHENDDLLLLANNTPIANGQVMLREDKILISVTKLLPRAPEVRVTNVLRTFGGEDSPEEAEEEAAFLSDETESDDRLALQDIVDENTNLQQNLTEPDG